MEEITVEFEIEDEDNDIDAVINIETSPTKLSEIDNDVGFIKSVEIDELTNRINNFQQAEDTEMDNILAIMKQYNDNFYDITKEN